MELGAQNSTQSGTILTYPGNVKSKKTNRASSAPMLTLHNNGRHVPVIFFIVHHFLLLFLLFVFILGDVRHIRKMATHQESKN